jgi:hypothetical protein
MATFAKVLVLGVGIAAAAAWCVFYRNIGSGAQNAPVASL